MAGAYKAGQYMLPWCQDSKELKDPEKKKRYDEGPHAILFVRPGPVNMGTNLLGTFILFVVISLLVGYASALACQAGAESRSVFRVAGTIGVLSYAAGPILHHIWMSGRKKILLDTIDNVIYGLVTGAIFAFMWPGLPTG